MWSWPLAFVLGVFGWSFAEYALHNWVGHLGRGRNDFSREHLAHHGDTRYFTPTPKKIVVAALSMSAPGALLVWWLGGAGASAWAGFALAYVGYEVLHRRIHTHPPRGWYGRWARRHHYYHHFVGPRFNHGVTSPLWDLVFRTWRAPERLRVPEKQAMVWLLDPATNDVRAELQRDYVLARRGDKRNPEALARAVGRVSEAA
jgi:sterol desaturase/sphingolipid hydroxylase (fatty acid hydroxylase superfamily)